MAVVYLIQFGITLLISSVSSQQIQANDTRNTPSSRENLFTPRCQGAKVFNQNPFDDLDIGAFVKSKAKLIGSHLRKISNEELGVTAMQGIYDSLPYTTAVDKTKERLNEMAEKLHLKLEHYLEILKENRLAVEELYKAHLVSPISSFLSCCNIAPEGLIYDEHFGIEVSKETACDIFPLNALRDDFGPSRNLSRIFGRNLKKNSAIKWQYFISATGIHSEYPAYISEICSQKYSYRHRDVYLGTVQPHTKYIVIVIDHGNSLSPQQLKTAKAIGKHILASLSHRDKVGVIGLAGEVQYPYNEACLAKHMSSNTYETKFHFSKFIDCLQKTPDPTNHTLGFSKAFEMMHHTLSSVVQGLDKKADALIVYISRGLLSSLTEAKSVFESIAKENRRISNQVVINTYVVIDDGKPVLYEKAFLQDIANQNYKKYDIHPPNANDVKQGKMVSVNTSENLNSVLGDFASVFPSAPSKTTVFSLPYWDTVGKGIVTTISQPVFHADMLLGVVGVDLSVSDLAEDVTYFSQSSTYYSFMIEESGIVVMHPYFDRPSYASEQPMHIDISHLENRAGFQTIRDAMLRDEEGLEKLVIEQEASNKQEPPIVAKQYHSKLAVVAYRWKKVMRTPYIICIVSVERETEERKLKSASIPSSPAFVYHRLDLLPPRNLCRHMKQLSTLDASTLFLSAGGFVDPFQYLTQQESKHIAQGYMAYLNDNTKLISNPGLKNEIRNEVLALGHITSEWIKRTQESELTKYIVRRYIATPNGILQMYPGSLVDKTYDPTQRDWFIRALHYPGRVVLTAPYLDIGGAGYVVTLSHTIYEGKSAAMHSSSDFVEAVMGMDLTLGYFYKLLVDVMPVCDQEKITCFLLDDRGYLIAHPDLIEPAGRGPVEQQHITHKEPLVANDILNHREFVQKKVCNSFSDRTVQRYYQFNTSLEGVLTNVVQGENCEKYQISAVHGSNVFLGIVNQTCDPMTAFCPCSMIDRLCLNCHRVEQTECECPCECPLVMSFCSEDSVNEENVYPTCPHFPEGAHMPAFDVRILDTLEACFETHCYARLSESECFGVLNCEWCQLESDGVTPLKKKFCTEQRKCFGGILGARTPYADEIIGGSSEAFFIIKSTPVGPVAGGIIGCFLVLALAIYCYHHVHRSPSIPFISSTPGTTIRMSQLDNEAEDIEHHEQPINPIGHPSIVASFENAALSPYRVNTNYRRPPGGDSDNGYGTMTTHEESEHLPCIEPLIGKDRPRIVSSYHSVSSSSASPPVLQPFSGGVSSSLNSPVPLAPWMVNQAVNREPSQTVLYKDIFPHGCHVLTQAQVHAMEAH